MTREEKPVKMRDYVKIDGTQITNIVVSFLMYLHCKHLIMY